MKRWQLYSGLTVSAALLTWLGVNKYREVVALQQLQIAPGKPAFQFVSIQAGIVQGLLHLQVNNSTQNNYRIKNLEAVTYMDANGKPGAYLASAKSVAAQVNANAVTVITIPVTFALNQLLTLAQNIFLSRTATIFLTGRVTYVTSGLSVPVPFSFTIDVRDQLNQFFQLHKIPLTL
jgi:hypothetical protein